MIINFLILLLFYNNFIFLFIVLLIKEIGNIAFLMLFSNDKMMDYLLLFLAEKNYGLSIDVDIKYWRAFLEETVFCQFSSGFHFNWGMKTLRWNPLYFLLPFFTFAYFQWGIQTNENVFYLFSFHSFAFPLFSSISNRAFRFKMFFFFFFLVVGKAGKGRDMQPHVMGVKPPNFKWQARGLVTRVSP